MDSDAPFSEILSKLEGLNSKDRRKLLRQLRRQNNTDENNDVTASGLEKIDDDFIAAVEEKARRVAGRNRSMALDKEGHM